MIPTASQEIKSVSVMLGHFGYWSLAGALYACLLAKRMPGIIYGPLVWAPATSAGFRRQVSSRPLISIRPGATD